MCRAALPQTQPSAGQKIAGQKIAQPCPRGWSLSRPRTGQRVGLSEPVGRQVHERRAARRRWAAVLPSTSFLRSVELCSSQIWGAKYVTPRPELHIDWNPDYPSLPSLPGSSTAPPLGGFPPAAATRLPTCCPAAAPGGARHRACCLASPDRWARAVQLAVPRGGSIPRLSAGAESAGGLAATGSTCGGAGGGPAVTPVPPWPQLAGVCCVKQLLGPQQHLVPHLQHSVDPASAPPP
jgi:hypothetical protein